MPAQDPKVAPHESDAPTLPPPAAEPAIGRWLWVIYPLAMVAMNAVWGGVMQVLLGKQIAAIVPEQAASAAALGMALSVSAVSSVASQPIAGLLSDRTRTRFLGRRNVWIFGAGIVGALGLVAMSQLTSTAAIAIAWAAMMWPLNATQASLTAVLPERVPQRLRGSMSGVLGAAGMIGAYAGVALAGLSQDLFMGYLLVAGLFLLLTQIFALTTKDRPAPEPDARSTRKNKAVGAISGLRGAPDYWWAFAGWPRPSPERRSASTWRSTRH